jgi:hypothetical protein
MNIFRFDHIRRQLGARRIEFVTAAVIGVVFAVCFAHLEYYFIKDPASNNQVDHSIKTRTISTIDNALNIGNTKLAN